MVIILGVPIFRIFTVVWKIVGQGPTVLAVGAGGGCLTICSLICQFSSFSFFLEDGPI